MRIIKQDLEVYTELNRNQHIKWHKHGTTHREDGPARLWSHNTPGVFWNYFKDDFPDGDLKEFNQYK